MERRRYEDLTPDQQALVRSRQAKSVLQWNYENEAEWQRYVIELARVFGWQCFHQHDSRRSEPGWPDLALIRPPDFVLAELKTNTGKLTRQQQVVLANLQACGVEVHVWRPADEKLIRERLKKREPQQPS